ncbi:enoyl-CoA hydratase-related protein [Phenylobacterium sp.]|uniref:enoyl-CoA hydratase-related protein n=1 Tax=Phenylobacterium sp. TaxID=1871053 RepID=UPI003D2C8F36
MTEHVLIETAKGVLTLTLNRPDKKNALSPEMYEALGDAIDGAADDPEVRCILIQANGDMFTSGNDLATFAAVNAGDNSRNERRGASALIQALGRAKTPVVAAVNGRAVGVGTTMLMHCDLVFLAEDALLTTPFVNLALVPEAASSITLPARIGHARAFSMFVLGEPVDAKKAEAWGIANAVVPLSELRATARKAAEAVASKPPSAVAITKALMRESERYLARMQDEGVHFSAQLKTAEAAEAFAAFREKRAPDFSKVS